jgi:DNA polymerase-4
VGVADLCEADEADKGDLLDQDTPRVKAREKAVDALREKFGAAAVRKGILLRDD